MKLILDIIIITHCCILLFVGIDSVMQESLTLNCFKINKFSNQLMEFYEITEMRTLSFGTMAPVMHDLLPLLN